MVINISTYISTNISIMLVANASQFSINLKEYINKVADNNDTLIVAEYKWKISCINIVR